jgi:hypothetical protein
MTTFAHKTADYLPHAAFKNISYLQLSQTALQTFVVQGRSSKVNVQSASTHRCLILAAACVCVCVCVCMYAYMFVCVCMHICLFVCMYVCMYV